MKERIHIFWRVYNPLEETFERTLEGRKVFLLSMESRKENFTISEKPHIMSEEEECTLQEKS